MNNKKPIIIKTISEYNLWRNKRLGSIGFVPTMGGLHDGHLSIIKHSISICDFTVVSIFLNPLQFSKNEDLKTYPSKADDDLKKLLALNVSVIFIPDYNELFSSKFSFSIIENSLSNCLEGQKRPDFFSGVLTIIVKLFNIISPSSAFFGKKDPQQLLIIKKLCEDLNFNIKIISCSTVREKNGLAMSSRNNYLSASERENASVIYLSLLKAKSLIKKNIFSIDVIQKKMEQTLLQCPNLKIDYISFSDPVSLLELKKSLNKNTLISIAVFIGKTRLIDSFFYTDN